MLVRSLLILAKRIEWHNTTSIDSHFRNLMQGLERERSPSTGLGRKWWKEIELYRCIDGLGPVADTQFVVDSFSVCF